jgi:hypothetical protein
MIPKDTVANAIVGATAMGARSLREADFLGRGPVLRELWGAGPSDTTLARVAGAFQGTAQVLRQLWRQLRARGDLGMQGEHVQVIDGTILGGQWTTVLAEIGRAPAIMASAPYPGRGNELSASIKLIKRLAVDEGRFTDYLLGDGLYACERFCRPWPLWRWELIGFFWSTRKTVCLRSGTMAIFPCVCCKVSFASFFRRRTRADLLLVPLIRITL